MRVRGGGARRRWGGTLVESAVVGSLALMLLLGTIVVGMGVFRYQQVADLAREGTRYGSVNSQLLQLQTDQGNAALNAHLLTYAAGLDPNNLQCSFDWTAAGVVTVNVTYQWAPEAYLGPSAIKLTGKSTTLITN